MTDQTVPATKPASDLKEGDWIAPRYWDTSLPAEVNVLHPYVGQNGRETVLVGFTELGAPSPDTDHVYADIMLPLATDAEVAKAKATHRRIHTARELRRLADLIVNQEAPLPRYGLRVDFGEVPPDEVAALAETLGGRIENAYTGRDEVIWPKGHLSYEDGVHAIWWARAPKDEKPAGLKTDAAGLDYTRVDTEPDDPTPVSPARVPLHTGGPVGTVRDSHLVIDETPGGTGLAPAPIAVHYETRGWKGEGPGSCGVECACGVAFDGFDSIVEAGEQLDRHIAESVVRAVAVSDGCE